jgi:hypothetical protein
VVVEVFLPVYSERNSSRPLRTFACRMKLKKVAAQASHSVMAGATNFVSGCYSLF